MSRQSRQGPAARRRDVLKLGGAGLVGTALVPGCDLLSTDPDGQDDTGGGGDKGPEAPMLAQRVEDGELPPVEDRLPNEPMVVEPVDRIGQYGGEWRSALRGTSDVPWLYQTIGYENLVRWDLEWADDTEQPIPNLAEEFDVGDDGRQFTFRLREGIRWSDGEPFTANDIAFAVQDVLLNTDITPVPPTPLAPGGEPVEFEQLGEHEVRFTFAEPNGFFLRHLASAEGFALTNKPRHYLEEFHRDHNPDIDELVQSEGVADWVELFEQRGGVEDLYWQTADLPTLHGWVLTTAVGDGARVVAERNPYYWKTDPDGSQLPYIDRVVYDVIDETEVILTRAMNGEIDMHMRHINIAANKPVLAQNREEGDYDFFETPDANMNTMMISLNLTHPDEVKREIFQNKDFRIGLSHAINRQEIIDAVFQGQGEPWQGAPLSDSPFYDEEMAKQYTEFDVDLANQHLDQAGYTDRNDDGIRLGPDGEPISFNVQVRSDFSEGVWVEAMELIRGYWLEVGIDANNTVVERTLYEERVRETTDFDAAIFIGHGGLEVLTSPMFYFPFGAGSEFAPGWWFWYQDREDERGEEPPEAPRRQMELYDQILTTVDVDEQIELMRELLEIGREEFYSIGISTYGGASFGIVKNNFHNVPAEITYSVVYTAPGPSNSAQYFISEE